MIEVYNLTNQKLDSDELTTILQYSTMHFAGGIENNPVSISGTTATLQPGSLLVDGIYFSVQDGNLPSATLTQTTGMIALVIDIGSIKSTTSIATNSVSDYVTLEVVTGFTGNNLTVTENDGIISILDSNNVGWSEFKYDAKKFTSYKNSTSTVAKSGSFYIVPIAYLPTVGSNLESLFKMFDLEDYKQFLTEWAVEKLIEDSENKYVWRDGGVVVGDIGDLNITGRTISKNKNPNDSIVISSPIKFNGEIKIDTSTPDGMTQRLLTFKKNTLDKEYVWRSGGAGKGDIGELNITGNVLSNKQGTGNDRIDIAPKYVRFTGIAGRLDIKEGQAYPVWMESNGNISAKYRNLPISMGGTGAATWMDARSNLHFHVCRVDRPMDSAIVYMKETYRNEPAGTVCFLVAHYNNKHDLAICLKRSAAGSSSTAWDIIEQ